MLPGIVSLAMGNYIRKYTVDSEVDSRNLTPPAMVRPLDKFYPETSNLEVADGFLGSLPPSREQFHEMLSRGDIKGVDAAMNLVKDAFKARSQAAMDEYIRELEADGMSDEGIGEVLNEIGWIRGPFGAYPKDDPPEELKKKGMTIIHNDYPEKTIPKKIRLFPGSTTSYSDSGSQ
jgi:hypothetical protein